MQLTNPIDVFRQWHALAAGSTTLSHPGAMCVSTIDSNGNPDARFVDLKAVQDDGFVFCTSFHSRKGEQITGNPHVALTFWWDHIGRQVRVVGTAHRTSDADSDRWFGERSRDAQLTTWAFEQSAPLTKHPSTHEVLDQVRRRFGDRPIPRPGYWGGYLVRPYRIEFLTFEESRVHRRELYELQRGAWAMSELQP